MKRPTHKRIYRPRHGLPRDSLSRRRLLQALGLGGAVTAAGLPSWFGFGREARADVLGGATRVVLFVTSHGTVYDNWKMRPAGQSDDQDWEFSLGGLAENEFSTILQPLHGLRDKLLVLDGVADGAGPISAINEHESGHAAALTGRSSVEQEGQLARPDGPSIDQIIAAQLESESIIRSLEYSVGGWPVCFDDQGNAIPYEGDPYEAYYRLFPDGPDGGGGEPTDLDRIRSAQPSVLDFLGGRYESLYSKLGAEDRVKIEQHRELLRDLELQLANLAQLECDVPQPPMGSPMWGAPTYPKEMLDIFFGLTQVALTCGVSRMITIRCDVIFNETIGAPPGDLHNDYAHQASTDPVAGAIMTDYHTYQANRFRELVELLDSVPEGNGTMLDNTVCVWYNELATGEHTMNDLPIVIAGGGGYFDLGRYVHWRKGDTLQGPWSEIAMGPAHNKFLVTLARSVGVDIDRFGRETLPRAGGGEISTVGMLDRVALEG